MATRFVALDSRVRKRKIEMRAVPQMRRRGEETVDLSVKLSWKELVEKVQLQNTHKESLTDGCVVEELVFLLGGKKYSWNVVESDIGDVILRIDFLK